MSIFDGGGNADFGAALGGMLNGDSAALRAYVTAKDGQEFENQAEGEICFHVTHSHLKTEFMEMRLNVHMTIAQVKAKLYTHSGTAQDFQRLLLKRNGSIICEMNDLSRKLGFYSPQNGMEIHIQDLNPNSLARSGWLDNVNLVQKYQISEEDYNKRTNTVRRFKQDKLKEDPNWVPPQLSGATSGLPRPAPEGPPPGKESVEGMEVGNRCEVSPGGRRGSIKFIGEVPFELTEKQKPTMGGYWIGVQYDEPVGRNDGTFKGHRIFECQQGFGGFVRPKLVTVGDFPEIDLMDMSSDDDEL